MPERAYKRGQQISILGLFLNAALGIAKLVAGLLGNSTALVADAIESLTDLISSLIVWSGLQIAKLPPDDDHPYGHGRAEALATLVVVLMLFGAAAAITIEAIGGIRNPSGLPAPFTLAVLIPIILIKETMYRFARRTAQTADSSLVLADAWHHRVDAMTSLAATAGISIALFGGEAYAAADDWAALFAAGMIIYNAFHLLLPPVNELMDREQPEMNNKVRRIAGQVPGVAGVEKVFARKSGLLYWIDMHVEVDPDMTVRRAHAVGHDVKGAICSAIPQVRDVLVHLEPYLGHQEPDVTATDNHLPADN